MYASEIILNITTYKTSKIEIHFILNLHYEKVDQGNCLDASLYIPVIVKSNHCSKCSISFDLENVCHFRVQTNPNNFHKTARLCVSSYRTLLQIPIRVTLINYIETNVHLTHQINQDAHFVLTNYHCQSWRN